MDRAKQVDVVLVLQGGGALGSYQAGVFEALAGEVSTATLRARPVIVLPRWCAILRTTHRKENAAMGTETLTKPEHDQVIGEIA